ncbi:DUF6083 domain-containing protein [Streptomyces sp. NPDC056817]|uniref:DUF6083 domain-containing protein n=1 Tax=Streptomyces sp. NPDC056817 TaxID=3345950 RepID=UPI003678C513
MRATRGNEWALCQICGKRDLAVRGRGRIGLLVELCDSCWNRLVNDIAEEEGATATPLPDPDPDDVSWIEPPICDQCSAEIRVYPTNYDRWVSLATREMPAKDVPERYRWRLVPTPAGFVAVRVRGIDPLPSDLVLPHHRMLCVADEDEARHAS